MKTRLAILISCLLLSGFAHATGSHKTPNVNVKQHQTQNVKQNVTVDAAANASAWSETSSSANSNSTSTASGGDADASATGGAAVATSGDASVSYYSKVERSAPALGQGSFALAGCGAGGNVGGSNSSGAAFLGFGFTPAECYAFMLAQSYEAIGETVAACQVLNTTNAAKRAAKRGAKLPACEPKVVAVAAPVVVPPADYVTQEQLDRAFKKSLEK